MQLLADIIHGTHGSRQAMCWSEKKHVRVEKTEGGQNKGAGVAKKEGDQNKGGQQTRSVSFLGLTPRTKIQRCDLELFSMETKKTRAPRTTTKLMPRSIFSILKQFRRPGPGPSQLGRKTVRDVSNPETGVGVCFERFHV